MVIGLVLPPHLDMLHCFSYTVLGLSSGPCLSNSLPSNASPLSGVLKQQQSVKLAAGMDLSFYGSGWLKDVVTHQWRLKATLAAEVPEPEK